MVRVELERRARARRREDRRCGEHAIADPADLEDHGIGRDRTDRALDRRDHRVSELSGR
jgi:hypothetical protein